jgi:thiamine biosynthesis lipoprotein
MTAAAAPVLHRTEAVMGTMVSLQVREPLVDPSVVDAAFELLHDVDARFSPFKADSEISRLADGALAEADCSLDVRQVLAACDHLAETTNGAFDARFHRPDGRPDPSGFVKGWALEEAGWLLETAGARNYWLNAGGDIVARGESAPGMPWRVGIRHPDQADRMAAVLGVRDRAVATSGTYERGDHIVDPLSLAAPVGLRSVTVVGPGLAFTDAYATAIYVMGLDGLDWLAREPDYEAFVITDDDRSIWTPGMERFFLRDS